MIFRSLRSAVPHLLVLSLSFSLLALPAFADSDSDEDETKKTMTGVWITRPAAPFVYQDPDGFEPGVAAPVKEITLMRWELEEDEHGLITGYNTYYSMDDQGGSQSRGTLCMVGARQGSKVLLSEAYAVYGGFPVPELSTTTIFRFDCEKRGRNKLKCIGDGLSSIPPTVLKAVLVRSKRAGDVIPVPEAAREICQPGA
jgi:hypothetical protein